MATWRSLADIPQTFAQAGHFGALNQHLTGLTSNAAEVKLKARSTVSRGSCELQGLKMLAWLIVAC